MALVVALGAILAPAAVAAQARDVRTVELGGLEARSAALLLSGQEAGDLDASFLALPLAASAEGTSVLLVADLVGAALLEAASAPEMIVEAYAYLLDGQGGVRATMTRAFRLDLDARRARLETGGVKLLARLDGPGGLATGSLRLLVLHRASGRFALRTLPLPPPLPAAAATPMPPLVVESRERWLVARADGDELPAVLADPGRLPATRLVATAGGTLPLRLAAGSADRGLVLRLVDSSGRPLAGLEAAPADAVLDLGDRQPQVLQLEIADPDDPRLTSRLPLELVAGRLPAGALWFDRAPPAEPAPVAPAAQPRRQGLSALQRLALGAYRRSFDAWNRDDLQAAVAELRRFEADAIATAEAGGEGIEIAQRRAAAELAALDPEGLVPLMCLHERLYRYYYGRQRYGLATHSRRMALGLAQLYAERGGGEAHRTAALVLVSLAGLRQEVGARLDALSAFEAAIEMDPRQPEALLGLAALHESMGHYETTVELLRRLDRSGPMPPAAAIRLAINLARVGANRQAATRLSALRDSPVEWIARLAHQELARLLAGSQRGEEALEVLTAARDLYPQDQGLTIQLAALLDRLGKPLAGQRVLAGLEAGASDSGASPRLRYSEMPSAQIDGARRRLAVAAADRLAAVVETARSIQEADAS